MSGLHLAVSAAAALALAPAGRPAAPSPLGRARDDLRTGHYERARQDAAAAARGRGPLAVRAAVLAARAEERLGLLGEARRRLEEASVHAPDDLPLRAELMRVANAVGDRGAVKTLVDQSYEDWRSGKVNKSSPPDLVAMAVALRLDNNYDDANATLTSAVKLDPRDPEANLEWGDIFLEKDAADRAEASFRDVLKHDPTNPDGHAGLARAILELSHDVPAAEKEIAAALAVNPRHAGALFLRGQLALDGEEMDRVAGLVTELRRTDPHDAGAAALAASRALLGDDRPAYEREKEARLAVRPADGDFFAQVAETLMGHRRYQDAREVAQEGVRLDGNDAHCLTTLALTLLRLGSEREGVAMLRRSRERDPYARRTFNLLELFENVIPARYISVETAHLTFRVSPRSRPAIEAVVGPFLEEVYRRYVERYGFTPAGKVAIELYSDPAHYAIRTVGLPQLEAGVTAVCFGNVITSQDPTNADFNWGLVLAHELAHVFTLQLSRFHVPLWLSEGLSELETTHLRPLWRRHGELGLWSAVQAGTLAPLARLSQTFVRSNDAYLHAAAAVEFLEERFGFAKIREALVAFGRGQTLVPVLEALSGQPLAALEKAFRDDLTRKLASYRDQFLPAHEAQAGRRGPGEGARGLAEQGLAALYDGDTREARAALARALLLRGGREEPRVGFLAAELALGAGEAGTAVDELNAIVARGFDGYDVRLRLGVLAGRADDRRRAEEHLRKAIAFAPTEVEPRMLLASLLEKAGRHAERQKEEEALFRVEPESASLAKRVVLQAATGGRPETVIELGPEAIFIDPADPDMHAALGRALAAARRDREARESFERALRLAPANGPALHRALAEVLDRLGDGQQAALHRQRAADSSDGGLSGPGAPPPPRSARPPRAPPPAPLGLPLPAPAPR